MDLNLVLTVLSDLIEHENMVVRTHVNGTLYSILTRKNLKIKAREMEMNIMLIDVMTRSDEQLTRQIEYILNQLNSDEENLAEEDGTAEEQEDEDEDYGDEETLNEI